MAFPAQEITGTILYRIETGEHHLRFMVFSAAGGLQPVLMRKVLSAGRLRFPIFLMRSSLPCRSERQMGSLLSGSIAFCVSALNFPQSTNALSQPQELPNFILITVPIFWSLRNSLIFCILSGCIERRWELPVVRFKMLYAAREEGYPVKQSWLEGMDKNESDFAHGVLFRKISDQSPRRRG